MTYYPDLTLYQYITQHLEPNTLNVGWLDISQSFNTGATPIEFQGRLAKFCSCIVLPTRGFHICNICLDRKLAVDNFRQRGLGTSEIRVFYKRAVYAAPNLIYHYVVDHMYKPPDEFIEAVLSGPLPDVAQYQELIEQLGVEHRFITV